MGISCVGNHRVKGCQDWSFFELNSVEKKVIRYVIDRKLVSEHLTFCRNNDESFTPHNYEHLARSYDEACLQQKNIKFLSRFSSNAKQIYTCLKTSFVALGKLKLLIEVTNSVILIFTTEGQKKVLKLSKRNADSFLLKGELLGLKFSHPNLLHTEGVMVLDQQGQFKLMTRKNNAEAPENAGFIASITEYKEGFDDLVNHLNTMERFLSEEEIRPLIYEILKGLNYMHERGIMHRDIKAENILCIKTIDPRGRVKFSDVKILDYGFCTMEKKASKVLGTPKRMAPEIKSCCFYGKKVDIWGMGLVSYVCRHRIRPDRQKELAFLSEDSSEYKDLIRKMRTVDPSERISAEEALNHPWFQEYNVSNLKEESNDGSDNNERP